MNVSCLETNSHASTITALKKTHPPITKKITGCRHPYLSLFFNDCYTICMLQNMIHIMWKSHELVWWLLVAWYLFGAKHFQLSHWHGLVGASQKCPSVIYYVWTWGPFYKIGLTLISAWICNHMQSEVWGETTYPFPKFSSAPVEVWKWKSNFILHFMVKVITHPLQD